MSTHGNASCLLVLAGAVAAVIVMQCWLPVFASKSDSPIDAPISTTTTEATPGFQCRLPAFASTPGFITIGHIPISADQLMILAESARVKIRRDASVADIIVSTNQPHDWNLSGASVRQAALISPHGGVSMLADKLGSRAIVNGKIYPLPAGSIPGGISLGKDGVMIGGKKLEPIPGTEMPGFSEGPDSLEVVVPDSYMGSLKISTAKDSQIELNSWSSGSVECFLIGSGSFNAGKLALLSKAVVDINGSGSINIKDLSAKVFVANVNGPGKVSIAHGLTDMSNATITGDGTITLNGTFKNLKKAVQGQGTISVSN